MPSPEIAGCNTLSARRRAYRCSIRGVPPRLRPSVSGGDSAISPCISGIIDSWSRPRQVGRRPTTASRPSLRRFSASNLSGWPNFAVRGMGAFWKVLDSAEWPRVSDAPLLPVQFEPCTREARWSKGVQVHVSQDPSSRLQITNAAGDRMIQLQNTRFHFNWLGQAGRTYPRYEKVRTEFSDVYGRFLEFVRGEGLGELRPNQWEVTYLNHILKGTVWREPNDWGFFQLLRGAADRCRFDPGREFWWQLDLLPTGRTRAAAYSVAARRSVRARRARVDRLDTYRTWPARWNEAGHRVGTAWSRFGSSHNRAVL